MTKKNYTILILPILSNGKKENGFKADDIIIGRFGTLSSYKDNRSTIRALECLPEQYKLVFVGGGHPHNIRRNAVDKNIADLLDFLEERKHQGNDIAKRIRFFGIVDNDVFYKAMANVTFVIVPHYESGQSASAIASLALEFGKKVITTYNSTFKEYQRFYPNCFEMFDIGNYFELRDKILNFDLAKYNNAQALRDKYTANTLAREYKNVYDKMCSSDYINDYEPQKLEQLLTLLTPTLVPRKSMKKKVFIRLKQRCPTSIKKPLRLGVRIARRIKHSLA